MYAYIMCVFRHTVCVCMCKMLNCSNVFLAPLSVCVCVCAQAREYSSKASNLVKGSQEAELLSDVQELSRLVEEQAQPVPA